MWPHDPRRSDLAGGRGWPVSDGRKVAQGFHVATDDDIRSGRVGDAYFARGAQVLRDEGRNPQVVAEIRASGLPRDWPWAVFCGLDEATSLLAGRGVDVAAMGEGSLFFAEEPILMITGPYLEFGELETALLGLLCQASGIATAAARVKVAADARPVYSFGARRMHPAIAPMIERAAFVGGCDGVATVAAADLLGIQPVGTMAHALVLILGEERAWRGFDRVVDRKVPRVALVDTFQDERTAAVAAARILGDHLAAVRLDTPASRRGDLGAILREVRWELDLRGFTEVRLFVSGGIDEAAIVSLNPYADAYGVGTAISNAPVIDFAMDIVEVDGQPRSKRGKLSGRKLVWICPECGNRGISLWSRGSERCPRCRHRVRSLLERCVTEGKVRARPSPRTLRERTLAQVQGVPDPFDRGA
jgi:nicotinate phosphoribosyltransferase